MLDNPAACVADPGERNRFSGTTGRPVPRPAAFSAKTERMAGWTVGSSHAAHQRHGEKRHGTYQAFSERGHLMNRVSDQVVNRVARRQAALTPAVMQMRDILGVIEAAPSMLRFLRIRLGGSVGSRQSEVPGVGALL